MRYSEMTALEKQRAARRGAPLPPSRLVASSTGVPWWPVAVLVLALALLVV